MEERGCTRTSRSASDLERTYRRRDPESGVVHRVLSDHLLTFLARVEDDETRSGLPRYVRGELLRAHECGVLAYGFARLHCTGCHEDMLVPFSCKGRGFCPSCGGRRMAEAAAHLVDHVLPYVPVRQWVLSMPWRLRFLLACDVDLLRAVRRCFLRTIASHYRARAVRHGLPDPRFGAINVVQRFGSALNLNVHFHALVLDGVFAAAGPGDRPVFHAAPPLEDEEVIDLVVKIRDRILRLLRRRGKWPTSGETDSDPPVEDESLLPFLSAASIQGQVALGPSAGQRLKRLGQSVSSTDSPTAPGGLCASVDGFSLHAQVRVEADERERLEHLCRYVARPALAAERLSLDDEGRVLLELRHPWRDGTTHIVFEPLVFLERLAALVPHPREHQLTYHGVLAPASPWRDFVVPALPKESESVATAHTSELDSSNPDPEVFALDSSNSASNPVALAALGPDALTPPPASPPSANDSSRYSWAELLRRVFGIDVLHCPTCGSRRRLIALLSDPPVVRKILNHMGLPADPPALAPARSPPQMVFGF